MSPDAPSGESVTARVVGIGASAGGLAALRAFVRHVPPRSGLSFVIVPHLSSAQEGYAPFLQGHAHVPIETVADGVQVTADRIYVLPPGPDLLMVDGSLKLVAPESPNGGRAPIDRFFRSLAGALGKDAAGVILSGTGADGSIGLKWIKEQGGLTVAQDPADAEYDGMPRAAIGTGLVDLVAPAADIPARLISIVRDTSTAALEDPRRAPESTADALRDILTLVRIRTGHDFSSYKRATLLRRISRRMQVFQTDTIVTYLKYLRDQPGELTSLLRDFLISVTSFFRDPEAWAALDDTVLARLFESRDRSQQVRIWVPGCATGEEAYTLAMLCAERGGNLGGPQVQIFATDIDEEALVEARAGRYPSTIAADLSAERLERYFVPEGPHLRVRKEIREAILFSPHNVLRDPPFSKLDLVTCRNLLIYLDRDAQERVLGLLHFGLRPDGYLFLGSSESAESPALLFAPIDGKQRIFIRRPVSTPLTLPTVMPTVRWHAPVAPEAHGDDRATSFGELHYRLLEEYAPPSVLVTDDLEIVHLSEHAGRYLTTPGGEPTRSLLRIVLPELRLELRSAIYAARQPGRGFDTRAVRAQLDGGERLIRLTVRALDLPQVARGMLLVMFDEREAAPEDIAAPPPAVEPVVRQLEEELQRTRDQLRATVEQYETSVEELKASNEELHAINEELRSATEELETSKEELQSVNEELTTLNHELKDKIDEVSRANSDLQNLMTSTEIAVLFLDRQLNIQRFTPRARDIFNVIPSDVGRPLAHLTHKLETDELPADAGLVLEHLRAGERAVRSKDGRQYLVRIHPYRSVDDRIDGVVLTFLDVTELELARDALEHSHAMLQLAERAADAGLWEIDPQSRKLRMSGESLAIHGLDLRLTELELDDWLARIVEDDRGRVAAAVTSMLDAGAPLDVEFRIVHPIKGERRLWALGNRSTGITVDITTRRGQGRS